MEYYIIAETNKNITGKEKRFDGKRFLLFFSFNNLQIVNSMKARSYFF